MTNLTDRTFGLEIEGFLPMAYYEQFPTMSWSNRQEIGGSPKTVDGKAWVGTTDSSLSGAERGTFPLEINSPVMTGEDGLIDTLSMIDYLNEISFASNQSCGIHIHVGARDLTEAQQAQVILEFVKFEKGFYALNGKYMAHRYDAFYSTNSTAWNSSELLRPSKYQSLNWANLSGSKGTFEMRLFDSRCVKTPEALLLAVMLFSGLIDAVKAGKELAPADTDAKPSSVLSALIAALGITGEKEIEAEIIPAVAGIAKKADTVFARWQADRRGY